MRKVYSDATTALAGLLKDGMTIMAGGFGLCGIPEVLGTDNEALAIPGDAADLSRIMAASLGDPGWQARVMPRADDFRSRFSASIMARDMLDLYRDILDSPGLS